MTNEYPKEDSETVYQSTDTMHDMRALTRTMTEMSIECDTQDDAKSLVLDDNEKLDRMLIERKVKAVFELPKSEVLRNEFPCYLIRLVTLPGWMYVMSNYICFYASLPTKKKGPYKAGYLSKKNHITSPRTYRYYFELRNHVLSWYSSAETKYAPLNSIDLKCIVKIEPSRLKKCGIRLTTNTHHHYTMIADSETSQREWMDELRRGVFMAQHAGNSVRIVLPFTKILNIDKPPIFEFAETISIKFQDDLMNTGGEDYYFSFFPNIEEAYQEIISVWADSTQSSLPSNALSLKSSSSPPPQQQQQKTMPTNEIGSLSFDSLLENVSPAALPTMLMGKLMSVTSLFQLHPNTVSTADENDLASDSDDESKSNENPKSKRYSFFSKQSGVESDPNNLATVSNNSQTTKARPHSASYSFTRIPRTIKNQMFGVDSMSDQPAAEENTSKNTSLSSLYQNLFPFYLHNKSDNIRNVSSSLEAAHTDMNLTSGDISLMTQEDVDSNKPSTALTRTRKKRAKSMGSALLSNTWGKLAPSMVDNYYQQQHINESHHRHPQGPIWLADKMIQDLENSQGDSDGNESDNDEDNIAYVYNHKKINDTIKQEQQQTMNEHLNANFPMLLEPENVQAVFKASFWRTIPYSGKIYITDRYFCFHSKVLAGKQKFIVPWQDIIQVKKLKTRSYYLLHGLTIIVKDIADEVYFDFSSLQLRNLCYQICQLKRDNTTALETSSVYSRESNTGISIASNIILDRPEHIEPPQDYDGPPLLSSSTIASQPSIKYKKPAKPLHITCLTIGSRGDVQPYLALCKELKKDGHTCRIATHPEYENWITDHDIEFRSIGGDPGDLMKLCIDNSFLSVSFIREGTKFFYEWFESLLQSSYEACQGTNVIIESPSAMVGVHMAEKLQVPFFRSMPFPFTRTTKFPHPFATQNTGGGGIFNDMTYVMIDTALWAGTARYINRFRRQVLGLPSTTLDRLELWKVPYLYSFSPTVVHHPKDWPDYIHCTGYWFLDNPDRSWQPDPSLLDFLHSEDKRPIVYIGFGSIIVPDPVETTLMIVNAVLKANVRAIICKGWSARASGDANSGLTRKTSRHKESKSESDVENIKHEQEEQDEDSEQMLDQHPGTIYHIESVPHDWLFPQIQGVVHHGGAGTTAAGLRAGLPTIIKPFFGDQRFWGQRIEELQVGVCLNKLKENQLTEAIKTITQNTAMIVKAQMVGEAIRKENGPQNAVECMYREMEFARQQRIPHS